MESPVVHSERRRATRRRSVDEHELSSVRIRSGPRAVLVDVSVGGTLLETEGRLLPGTSIDLSLEARDQRISVRGRVLRSSVAGVLSGAVSYRSAIAFDRPLARLAGDASGYPVPLAEARACRWFRAEATPASESDRKSVV